MGRGGRPGGLLCGEVPLTSADDVVVVIRGEIVGVQVVGEEKIDEDELERAPIDLS